MKETRPDCAMHKNLGFGSFSRWTLFHFSTSVALLAFHTKSSSMALTRTFGTSKLARQIPFEEAWKPSTHSRFCCLIYATQNGWKVSNLLVLLDIVFLFLLLRLTHRLVARLLRLFRMQTSIKATNLVRRTRRAV